MKHTKNIKLEIIEKFIDWAGDEGIILEPNKLKTHVKDYVLDHLEDEVKDGVADLVKACQSAIEDNVMYLDGRAEPSEDSFTATADILEDAIKPFK